MDGIVADESMDALEVRSEGLGQKRPLEDCVVRDSGNKKARGGDGVKEVAEMVLVLAAIGKMRAGRKPAPVEVKMMAEAREKLAEVCKEFAPKDIFPRDAFGTIIDDLGLGGQRETMVGIRPPKMSIAEKLQITKQKMKKAEVFPLHSATCTPPPLQSNLSGAVDTRMTSNPARMYPSDKANPSARVQASPVNSRTLPYQLPTSEVRPGASNVFPRSHLGRDSTALPVPRAGRPHLRSDERSNANPATVNTPTWSMQPQSASLAKVALDKQPAHLTNINHNMQRRMNFLQGPAADTHNEIGKIVQKLLQPLTPEHLTWTPPSRDYMNKPLTCQTCKGTIADVDNTLVCDACERGYHLRCLHTNPKAILGDEWLEWHCTKCLAISNGKPLPPKYGRVMRNITTPKPDENFNQRLMMANGNLGSQNVPSVTVGNNNRMTIQRPPSENHQSNSVEKASENKLVSVTESQNPTNSESARSFSDHLEALENHHDDNQSRESSHNNGIKLECNPNGKLAEKSEASEGSSSSIVHDVEWVGGMLKEVDGKRYYRSCRVNGTVYNVKDYALFVSTGNKFMPNKLQGMWEDHNTSKKWVTVTRCFFPDNLPDGVGRPCAPEINEVYESNHEETLIASLIHGPCEVLPPGKFTVERVTRNRLRTGACDNPKPRFLCKWFYDETKRLFRDVTC